MLINLQEVPWPETGGRSHSPADLVSRRSIARGLFGEISWESDDMGYLTCPGQHLHTKPSGVRDCRLHLDGAPTVFCFHQGCREEIVRINRLLRSKINKATPSGYQNLEITNLEKHKTQAYEETLRARAKANMASILDMFSWDPVEAFEASPVSLDDRMEQDWRLLLSLFAKVEGLVWIGDKYDSGKPHHARNFKPVSEWLSQKAVQGPLICPCTFMPGSFSRSQKQVLRRLYLVVESDTLDHKECCSIFMWMRKYLTLRAIVNTGGKSLHGWFQAPNPNQEAELRVILPALGFDPAMFRDSQPCRLPGVLRSRLIEDPILKTSNYQSLLWLDLEGIPS